MSTQANGGPGLSSAWYSSRKNHRNGTYTSLLECNGSFGSTFWYHDSTNRPGSDSNEEMWSTTANVSTADEGGASQGDSSSPSENITAKRAKRKV